MARSSCSNPPSSNSRSRYRWSLQIPACYRFELHFLVANISNETVLAQMPKWFRYLEEGRLPRGSAVISTLAVAHVVLRIFKPPYGIAFPRFPDCHEYPDHRRAEAAGKLPSRFEIGFSWGRGYCLQEAGSLSPERLHAALHLGQRDTCTQ
ncbi:hypothetical protein C8Q70DRAFT_704451 [Cubamyces menziesii]|nr:hypothetical protein C8Q70DRAFT_704451 [Cubamyces menziesii]